MILRPTDIKRLKQEKLSVVQRHVLGCMQIWWAALFLIPVHCWLWRQTANLYVGILGFVIMFTWIGLSFHLFLNPMRKIVRALQEKQETRDQES